MRCLFAALIMAFAMQSAYGQVGSEYQAKAAFLYNFTKFVEWPAVAFSSPSAPINLCVLGEESFGPALDAIQERQAQGRPLTVRRLTSLTQVSTCHILFVCASEEKRVRQVLAATRGLPVLTVGEIDHFADQGGVINLSVDDKKIRMEANLDAAHRQDLKISSQLLRIARIVIGEP